MSGPSDRAAYEILVEAGLPLTDLRAVAKLKGYVSRALNVGYTGPELVNLLRSDRTGGELNRVVGQKEKSDKAAAEAAKSNVARLEVGLPPKAGFTSATPQQATAPSDVVSALGAAGYKWLSGSGPSARWLSPNGVAMTENEAIVTAANGGGAQSFEAQLIAQGYIPVPDRPGVYFNPTNGDTVNLADKSFGGSGVGAAGGVDNSLGWSQLGESRRQFDAEFERGKYEFQTKFDRSVFTDDRAYAQAQDQYAKSFAENARQFDVGEAGTNRRFDVTAGQNATDEQGRNTRNAQSETAANERARLSSATTGFQSVNQLAPQLGQLALDNARFTKDTLSQAPDYLARAFFQQGQASPLPQVSQADVINNLRDNIAKYQSTLSGFNTTVPGFTSPTPAAVAPPAAVSNAPAGTSPPPTGVQPGFTTTAPTPAGFGGLGDLNASTAPAWRDWAAKYNAANAVPGMAQGGFTTEGAFRVGEEGPELILNPTKEPIAVVDAETTKKVAGSVPGFAGGTGAIVYDPVAQHWTQNGQVVNPFEAAAGLSAPAPTAPVSTGGVSQAQAEAAAAAWATAQRARPATPAATSPGFSFAAPTLPTFPAVTQGGLQALERSVRPPAVNAVMSGRSAASPRFGFSLPTLSHLNSLTADDKLAYNTALGTQFNETYENVEGEARRRAAGGSSRRAASVGFQ